MRVIETAAEMREARRGLNGRVALVATLGGLHAGHESLLVKAREVADVTVGSLFLNPTQFAPHEDLKTYPHDRATDLAVFKRHGAGIVFAPSVSEMYPEGGSLRVDPGAIGKILEGARRPGHFTGVATVVAKLFAIIRPDLAVFGEKDAQQVRVITRLSRELGFGTEIVSVPIVRDPDGLAMSTRNMYLNGEDRKAAAVLYRSLCAGRDLWLSGERDADCLRKTVEAVIGSEPRATLDYVSLAVPESLDELNGEVSGPALLSLAARVGPARLIDNMLLQ